MVLPLLIVLPILGFVFMLVVSWLSTFVPFFGNFLWALIFFGAAIGLAYLGIGKEPVFKTKKINVTLTTLLVIPALALILLSLMGISISSLFGSVTGLVSTVSGSAITGSPAPSPVTIPGALLTIGASIIAALGISFIFTISPITKALKKIKVVK